MARILAACLVAVGLLTPGAQAARTHRRLGMPAVHNRTLLRGASVESIPMFMYKQDCFKKRPVLLATGARTSASADMFPGAGMEPSKIEAFQTVLKDGFYHVDCIKDYMFYFGDKFGDHKYDYKLGEVSNVSIVLYDQMVSKQDREPMSHAVCFAFCRTVPDMVFFGITNGRSCYCMPYFRAMESDSAMCESVCEGDTSTTCGGKTKSTIFEMHMCQQTAENLGTSKAAMEDMAEIMDSVHEKVDFTATEMQSAGEKMQAQFGEVGDEAATALAQAAKVHAGEILETADEAKGLLEKMAAMQKESASLNPGENAALSFSKAEEAESLTAAMEEATAKADLKGQELVKMLMDANPDLINETVNATAMYKGVMYFVDKSYVDVPATCGGVLLGAPMVGTAEGCAKACEHKFEACVGFTWTDSHLCFLFSELKSVTYYTGCEAPKLLQAEHAGRREEATKCMVKFSKFSGTTLKPDPSGKCAGCLKEATKAARCP